MKKIKAIDIFCGTGSFSHGLLHSDIDIGYGIDIDNSCYYGYEYNNARFICDDIQKHDFKIEKQYFDFEKHNSINVLIGSPPCQSFSKLNNKRDTNDARANLLKSFLDAIEFLDPDIISFENVAEFKRSKILLHFLNRISEMGYHYDIKNIDCSDYGVPQKRKRFIFLASKLKEIRIPYPSHTNKSFLNVRDIIGCLPPIKCGETHAEDKLHRSGNLMPINLERIKNSLPGGTWKEWDERLLPNCRKNGKGQTYFNQYGRLKWDGLAPTITTKFNQYGTGRNGHPEQDRALSLREGALLQTFPKNYYFETELPSYKIATHIGNALPFKVAHAIGKQIFYHVNRT